MRLSKFIASESEQILQAWDTFAATIPHTGRILDQAARRDHAAQILKTIARDLETPQTDEQQEAKSKGEGVKLAGTSAAEVHADNRIESGVPIDAMITEYRALRASVLKLWALSTGECTRPEEMRDIMRFNEGIDQAIQESVTRYTQQTKRSGQLFIGILGHDIRNPLATINMSMEYLVRSGQLSRIAAQPVLNSAVRIKGLAELLVDFTRAQADGAMPLQREPGDLAQVIEKIVDETMTRHPDRLVLLECDGNFKGLWDEVRIGQLLSNLIGNAVSYGSRDMPIMVKMWTTPAEVHVSVHNHGQPIPHEAMNRIFEPLLRGLSSEGQERRTPDGLGLGLYICREIVQAHGGRINVTSSAGEGTQFIVDLPREQRPPLPVST